MITKTYHITIPSEILEAENIPAEDCLFFDIETTGLSSVVLQPPNKFRKSRSLTYRH